MLLVTFLTPKHTFLLTLKITGSFETAKLPIIQAFVYPVIPVQDFLL